MTVFVIRNGELVEKSKAPPKPGTAYIIGDNLPDTWNPLTNKRYSSKSRYYQDTRAAGGEIVGNDPAGLRERKFAKPNLEPPQVTIKRVLEQMGAK